MIEIRETTDTGLPAMMAVNRDAFGQEDEAVLVRDLLDDPTAAPVLSLMAFEDARPVGHILFTKARITNPEHTVSVSTLAPLAVAPDAQRKGIGGALIKTGLRYLMAQGADLVFVLGDPAYYSRLGFIPAKPFGLLAPHPLPEEYDDAWMVQALGKAARKDTLKNIQGTVMCSDTLNKAEYW